MGGMGLGDANFSVPGLMKTPFSRLGLAVRRNLGS